MGDKINIEDLKEIISGYETNDNNFTLDEILSEGKKAVQVDESIGNDIVIDNKDEPAISNEISDNVVKPEGVSITGAFEAIRTEKSAVKLNDNNSVKELTLIENDVKNDNENEVNPEHTSIEIKTEIEHKRYFNTEQFNSIKSSNSQIFKQAIDSFAKGEEEQDDGEEEYFKKVEQTEEIEDFENPEEKEDILLDLKKMNSSASFKALFTFFLAIISGVLFSLAQFNIAIPGISINTGSKIYLIIMLGLSLFASIINYNSLIKGFVSIIKFRCLPETMLFFVFISNSILNMIYLLGNEHFNGIYISFDFVYILLLTFNIFSKKLLVKNIYKNFLIASSDGQKTVVDRPEIEELANDIILETGNGGDILYATKSKFITDFIHNSFKDFDICSKHSPFCAFCAISILVFSVVTYFLTRDFAHVFAYASGAFVVTTPLLITFSVAVPIFINSSKARRNGGVVVGSDSAFSLSDVQTMIVDDSDVFNVALNGIRLYGETQIDECILYLASLFNSVGGPLKSLFSNMLTDSITSLPRADEIYYHDTMGYSCLIHSNVFVVGNKALMEHFGIDVDDSEFEIIYQQKSKNVLFVAYNGKLMGVFLLTYSLSHGVCKAFSIFDSDQMNVMIAERDANITDDLLHSFITVSDKSLFKIMKFRTARNCFGKFEPKNRAPSILLSNTGLKGIAAAFHACKSMIFAIKANKVIKIISSLIAFVLFTFLLVFSTPSAMLPIHILVYHSLWSLPVIFVSLFSK